MYIKKRSLILLSSLILLLAGCSDNMKVSAEEILQNAIESDKEVTNYVGISETNVYQKGELIEQSIMEEYAEGNKRKIVMTEQIQDQQFFALNDGETLIMYDPTNNQAHELELGEMENFPVSSPKEQFKMLM